MYQMMTLRLSFIFFFPLPPSSASYLPERGRDVRDSGINPNALKCLSTHKCENEPSFLGARPSPPAKFLRYQSLFELRPVKLTVSLCAIYSPQKLSITKTPHQPCHMHLSLPVTVTDHPGRHHYLVGQTKNHPRPLHVLTSNFTILRSNDPRH